MEKIKVLFICHGNICRSTMAEYVMKALVNKSGLSDTFFIDSAATSREEIGNPVHYGTRHKLEEVGIYCGNHKARQMQKHEYDEYDYIIGMDSWNIRNINRIIGNSDPEGKVSKLLDFTEEKGNQIQRTRLNFFWITVMLRGISQIRGIQVTLIRLTEM